MNRKDVNEYMAFDVGLLGQIESEKNIPGRLNGISKIGISKI